MVKDLIWEDREANDRQPMDKDDPVVVPLPFYWS